MHNNWFGVLVFALLPILVYSGWEARRVIKLRYMLLAFIVLVIVLSALR